MSRSAADYRRHRPHNRSDRPADRRAECRHRNWGKEAKLVPALSPQNHNLANMMPACIPCNLSKHAMPMEAWRDWIAGHVNSLNNYHPIYRLAKSYGLIAETGAPVVFYFEKVQP